LVTSKAKAKLESAQRRALLAISGAYNTTSTKALQVVTGCPSLHLEIEKRINIEGGMTLHEAQDICLNSWQQSWDNTTKGRTTHSFLLDLRHRM